MNKGVNSAAAGGLLFLVLRLLAVAHYDWDVAFSLADTVNFDDVIGILVGTFMGASTLSGILLAIIVPLLVARHARHIKEGEWEPYQAVFVVVLLSVFAAALVTFRDWPVLLVVLAASTLVFVVLRRHGPLRPLLDKSFAHMGVVLWVAFLAMGGLTDVVWVPEQRIGLRDGRTIDGYVMDVHSPYTKVLRARDREVTFVLTDEVTSRTEL